MQSWQKFCPDYLIVEWNEKNFNIKECPQYVIDAYHRKKWAFVTDYVRLRVVYEYGGIYFDTDVELVKKIDFLLLICQEYINIPVLLNQRLTNKAF